MAKTCVQVADGNMHQAVVHLAHTHLVTEPFVIGLQRNLAPTHPLHRLLRPHHEGTIAINDAANQRLTAPRGGVDAVMAGTIEFSRAAAVAGVKAWDFRASMLRTDLAARGVDDPHTLPNYPYRDDALLHWDALHDWVHAVVATYYTDADVARDSEIQAFFAEVGAPDGGRIQGIGTIDTVAELVDAFTHLIFTGSVQHAAVNFPQKNLMSFAPNMPLAGFAPAPTKVDQPPTAWLEMLPPLSIAQYQGMLGQMLGSVIHTNLGKYDVGFFGHFAGDARLDEPLAVYQERLVNIGDTIVERNRTRPSYKFLIPTNVPQGINI
jgi:arachidonate 15-lipoxygenase